MSLSPEQRAMRRTGLGGSDIAAIFGLDKFRTPLDVYLAKIEGWEPARTDDMMRGDHLEDGVARWFAEKHGVEVYNLGETLRHATLPHIFATPDRLITTALGGTELLSIKCPRSGDEFGEEETQDYPTRYNIQAQVEGAVLASLGYFLAGGWLAAPIFGELRRYPIRLDESTQQTILDGAERWWSKHIEAKVPPELDAGDGAREWLLKRFPGERREVRAFRQATLEEEALCIGLRAAEDAKDRAEAEYEALRRRVEEQIGNDDGLLGSFGKISWLPNQWSKRTFRKLWRRPT